MTAFQEGHGSPPWKSDQNQTQLSHPVGNLGSYMTSHHIDVSIRCRFSTSYFLSLQNVAWSDSENDVAALQVRSWGNSQHDVAGLRSSGGPNPVGVVFGPPVSGCQSWLDIRRARHARWVWPARQLILLQ